MRGRGSAVAQEGGKGSPSFASWAKEAQAGPWRHCFTNTEERAESSRTPESPRDLAPGPSRST